MSTEEDPREPLALEPEEPTPAPRRPESWAHRNAVNIMSVVLFALLAFVMTIQMAC
jgi:hypothetical protein